MRPWGALGLLALHSGVLGWIAAQGSPGLVVEEALPADDECVAAGGQECGLHALQLRGQKVANRAHSGDAGDDDEEEEEEETTTTTSTTTTSTTDAKVQVDCTDYVKDTGCGWTAENNCPGQADGTNGAAEDDGSTGFECCCNQGYWHPKARKPKARKPKFAKAFQQCGGQEWKGPTVCEKGYHCFADSEYYSQCQEGEPKVFQKYNGTEATQAPSTAPLMTFYMYRATNVNDYPLMNVNAGSLGGTIWYVHNEVVSCVYKDCMWSRRYGIDRIRRYKVQVRPPQPLFDAGMNFGIRYAFDLGQCTGPWDCNEQFENYGYFVGCNSLSAGFPFPTWPVYYNGSWFSLPGSCSENVVREQSLECKTAQPGGMCKGEPTGTGTCTFSYTPAGFIMLNDLEGIDDYRAFKEAGGEEFNVASDAGVNMTFWDGINDTEANAGRVQAVDDLFKKLYPNQPSDQEMPAPECDFQFNKFFPKGQPTKLNKNVDTLKKIRGKAR